MQIGYQPIQQINEDVKMHKCGKSSAQSTAEKPEDISLST